MSDFTRHHVIPDSSSTADEALQQEAALAAELDIGDAIIADLRALGCTVTVTPTGLTHRIEVITPQGHRHIINQKMPEQP